MVKNYVNVNRRFGGDYWIVDEWFDNGMFSWTVVTCAKSISLRAVDE